MENKFKVGDKVNCKKFFGSAIGTVLAIREKNFFPIVVDFEGVMEIQSYTADGRDSTETEIVLTKVEEERWKPRISEVYYRPVMVSKLASVKDCWTGGIFDKKIFEEGLCFKTEEGCNKYVNAITKLLEERSLDND